MSADLSLFSLDGLTAVVAGASRGIGFGLANGLAKAGASVIGFGRSPVSESTSFDYRKCDLNDADGVTGLFRDIEAHSGGIDVYVHVAGITLPSDSAVQSVEIFSKTVETNLTSAYRCCALVGQSMAQRRRGSIITVASIGALMGFPGNPGYVAAKGGLRMMSKALALDLGPSNVRVNCIVPGYIQTEMTAGSFNDPAKHQDRASRTMLGRWGHVDDMIGVAVFLASGASSYATGADFVIDGGWTAKGL